MKFIKFSYILIFFTLFSCDELYDNLFEDDVKSYSCSLSVTIKSWTKSTNNCSYIIDYNNSSLLENKGLFQIRFKTPKNGYSKFTNEVRIDPGEHSIKVQIENCNSADDIVEVCFISY